MVAVDRPVPSVPSRRLPQALVALVAVSVVAFVAVGIWSDHRPMALVRDATPLTAEALQDRYGILVNMVGVSAAGGMIDLRFTVTDPDKAAALFGSSTAGRDTPVSTDEITMPELVPEGGDFALRPARSMAHHLTHFEDAATVFLLYPNPDGVVQGGTRVSMVVGGIRLDGIVAQH